MSDEETLLVLVTCPPEAAEALARMLVERRLAACVNRIDGLRSVYRWRGTVETAEESLLLAKTTRARYAQLETAVRAQHPYELPEIVAVSLSCGLPAYLQWLAQSTQ